MLYPVTLDKERNFKYGMRAISRIEKKLNKAIGAVNTSALTMEEQAVLVWAGLVHEDKSLTPDKVIDLIDDYSTPGEIFAIAGNAMSEAFGKKDKDEVGDEKNA